MILKRLVVGDLQTNCYIAACETSREAIVIDPGGDAPAIERALTADALEPTLILLTHYHFDHVLAVQDLRAMTGAEVAIHELEAPLLADPPSLLRMFVRDYPDGIEADRKLHEDDEVVAGSVRTRVMLTPGHSPGGISLYVPEEKVVFCGDALFREGVGRTDFPGCSARDLMKSIREKLYALGDNVRVYPGHGPETTIGHERVHNPWVRG